MNKTTPTISIVLPAYNECMNIPSLIQVIQAEMRCHEVPYEIIVVDDGSSDETWPVLSRLGQEPWFSESGQLHCLQLSRNFGKESAVFAGLETARGQAVIVMDCDHQHPPQLISEMIQLWRESHVDVVEAVKSHRGKESLLKRLGSESFYALFRMLSGHDLKGSCDYKLLDRAVVDALLHMGERNLFFRGMVQWLGFKRHTLTFEVPERRAGISGWPIARLIKMSIQAITAYSFVPLRLVAVTGLLFLIAALLLAGYTLVYKLLGLAVSGFTTVILLQLITGSTCMLSIGVTGEYIARIYEEVKRRPRYVIAHQSVFDGQREAEPADSRLQDTTAR
ncbi:MAG: glycosyltransferase family 2 protein [Phycisphaerales bacterium]